MLPTLNLPFSDFMPLDPENGAQTLLPQDATEPEARFSAVLKDRVDEAFEADGGEMLPRDGKSLPAVQPEETTTPIPVRLPDTPVPEDALPDALPIGLKPETRPATDLDPAADLLPTTALPEIEVEITALDATAERGPVVLTPPQPALDELPQRDPELSPPQQARETAPAPVSEAVNLWRDIPITTATVNVDGEMIQAHKVEPAILAAARNELPTGRTAEPLELPTTRPVRVAEPTPGALTTAPAPDVATEDPLLAAIRQPLARCTLSGMRCGSAMNASGTCASSGQYRRMNAPLGS